MIVEHHQPTSKKRIRIAIAAAVAAAIMLPRHEARADEPVITTIAIGVVSSLVAAAIWSWWDEDPPPPPATKGPEPTIHIEIHGNNHNTININSTTNPAPVTPTDPNSSIRLPDDLSPRPILPSGIELTGTLHTEGADNSVATTFSDFVMAGSLPQTGFTNLSLETLVTNNVTFTRPDGASGQPAIFNLAINLDGVTFGTTDLPGTTANVALLIDVISPQFGSLFHSIASIAQGSLAPFIEGDIPVSAFSVSSPGNMSLSYVFGESLSVPDDLNEFSIATRITAVSVAAVPEPETYALFAAGLVALVALSRRRRSGSGRVTRA